MYLGLLLAVLSFPFMDLEVFQVGGKSIVLPYVAALLLAVPLLPRLPEAWRRIEEDSALPWLVSGFFVACLSSIWNYFAYPWDDIFAKNLTQLANLLIMLVHYAFFLVALRVVPLRRLARVTAWLVNVAALGAAYSLYQVAAIVNDWPLGDVARTSNLYSTGAPAPGWVGLPRAFGTAPEPGFWGAFLALAVAIVLGRGIRGPALLRLGLLLAAVVATFSRGAWLVTALVVILWAMAKIAPKKAWLLLPAAIPLSLALTAWPALVTEETALPWTDSSAIERVTSQKTGFRIFAEHPLLGVGFGSLEFYMKDYAYVIPGEVREWEHVIHSCFVLVLASTGLVGSTLFVVFLWRLMWPLAALTFSNARDEGLRLGALLGCVASLGAWLYIPTYNFSFVWFPLALAAALRSQFLHTGQPGPAESQGHPVAAGA